MNILKLRTAVLAFGTLTIGCDTSGRPTPVGPAAGSLMADAAESDAPTWSAWSAPVNLGPVVNSASNDQHPAISKDGLSLYISSDRLGGFGGTDIWVSQRASLDDPWGPLQNLGPSINSAGNDFAPTFTPDGHQLYFHS